MAGKKKIRRNVPKAVVHVFASFNNTIVTFAAPNGETLCWESAGTIGFKGSRKSTPFAAQKAAEQAAEKALKMGVREVEVRIKGPGAGRESAVHSTVSIRGVPRRGRPEPPRTSNQRQVLQACRASRRPA